MLMFGLAQEYYFVFNLMSVLSVTFIFKSILMISLFIVHFQSHRSTCLELDQTTSAVFEKFEGGLPYNYSAVNTKLIYYSMGRVLS